MNQNVLTILTHLFLISFLMAGTAQAHITCLKNDGELVRQTEALTLETQKLADSGIIEGYIAKKHQIFLLEVKLCTETISVENYCRETQTLFDGFTPQFDGIHLDDRMALIKSLAEQRSHCHQNLK